VASVAVETGDVLRRVPIPGEGRRSYVSESPDGRSLAFITSPAGLAADVNQLWIASPGARAAVAVTDGWSRVASVSWSGDARTLYYVSNAGGTMDLWQQRLEGDRPAAPGPEPLTAGVVMRDAAFARDGAHVAYSQGRRVANVWRVPILRDRRATWADAQQITADDAYVESIDVSPDGRSLVLTSDRGGTQNLWVVPTIGGELRRLTTGSKFEWGPRWSRDGLRLAFYSFRAGNRDIWTMSAAGGPWTQVTTNRGPDLEPAWSPDDSQIAHLSVANDVSGLWITRAAGGTSRLVAALPDVLLDWAPRGDEIAFVSHQRLWIASSDGDTPPRQIAAGPIAQPRWSKDGARIYGAGAGDREGNLFVVGRDGNGERAVTNLAGRRGMPGPLALATDGAYLYFTWDEDVGDLWVMDVERRR
jgi:Tol biopolymer transport system component